MTMLWDVQDTTPVARQTDPETSWEAARSVREETISLMKERILEALKRPRTDEGLMVWFHLMDLPGSPSGIRTRRKELQDSGLIKQVGESRTASGRKCGVFQVVR